MEGFGGSASVFDGTVQVEDEGTYICIAEHSAGSSTQTININVVGKYNVKFFFQQELLMDFGFSS